MSKVNGPLFSLGASGTFAKSIIFQTSNAYKTARKSFFVKDKITPARTTIRRWMSFAVSLWRGQCLWLGYPLGIRSSGLSAEQRSFWRDFHHTENVYGYWAFIALFVSRSIAGVYQYQTSHKYGFCLSAEWSASDLISAGPFLELL